MFLVWKVEILKLVISSCFFAIRICSDPRIFFPPISHKPNKFWFFVVLPVEGALFYLRSILNSRRDGLLHLKEDGPSTCVLRTLSLSSELVILKEAH